MYNFFKYRNVLNFYVDNNIFVNVKGDVIIFIKNHISITLHRFFVPPLFT